MPRPQSNQDYPQFFQKYIDYTKGNSIAEIIAAHDAVIFSFYNNLPEEKADSAYAENKWTVKELLQHLIDTERVFVYRALTLSRNDKTPLAGFDEKSWAQNSFGSERSLSDLKKEFTALHQSTTIFFQSLNETQLQQTGTANGNACSVNAIAFITYGHLLHHKKILEEKYLLISSAL